MNINITLRRRRRWSTLSIVDMGAIWHVYNSFKVLLVFLYINNKSYVDINYIAFCYLKGEVKWLRL